MKKNIKINILEIIYVIITMIFCFSLTIEKAQNGTIGEPEKGPILVIAFEVGIISLIYTICKLVKIKKMEKNGKDIRNDYNEMFLGAMTFQQSVIVVCSTIVTCFCVGLTDKEWVFHEKYLLLVIFFILQLILYYSFYKKQIKKENYFLKDYITMSVIALPILVISRFILDH